MIKRVPSRREKAIADDHAKALRLHREGQLARAELLYRKILAVAPDHFDALHLLGVVEGQNGNLNEALALLQRAVALRPDNAAALNNLGNTLGSLKRNEESLHAFERSLALNPDNPKALRNRGTTLRALKRPVEALASFDQALALKPDFPEAIVSRAEVLQELRRYQEAIAAFHAALDYGKDVATIRYALAALGDAPPPASAPRDYVAGLFDEYASHFDAHLVGTLRYRTPELLVQALQRVSAATLQGADMVDLGCGTGLCGPLLRPLSRRLVGVDLSAGMLDQARATGHYDELVRSEIAEYLAGHDQAFDVVLAADVFVYVGDLEPVFAAAQLALRPGGSFAFSVEAAGEGDYVLRLTRRYAHSAAYLQRLAASHGMQVEVIDAQVIREDAEGEVRGLLVVLRRP